MTTDRETAYQQLTRLAESLAKDIDSLTDDEVMDEIREIYGDPKKVLAETRHRIKAAVAASQKNRLEMAQNGYQRHASPKRPNVINLPFDRKRALIEHFAANDNLRRSLLTLAARNEEDVVRDIDSFLEDLVELDLIDEDGNIL